MRNKWTKWITRAATTAACVIGAAGIYTYATPAGYNLRILGAEMLLSSQHVSLAKWTLLPAAKLEAMTHQIFMPAYVNTAPIPSVSVSATAIQQSQVPTEPSTLKVQVITLKKTYSPTNYFVGKLMIVNDAMDVHLIASDSPKWGQQINVLAKRAGAIGAVNAGGFLDAGGEGNGGTPQGIVIVGGRIVHTDHGPNDKAYITGITKDGKLITGYYSANELIMMNVEYAAGFRPELIANGKKLITHGDGGWGYGPRTAIGQRKDGAILLLEIDGRQADSIGASLRQVQDILYAYGAVNAASMGGGSSSSMYFNGENITTPSSVWHIPRWLPNAWVVVPNETQSVTTTEDRTPVTITNMALSPN